MDAQVIVNHIQQMLDFCDKLDNYYSQGAGVRFITKGSHTARDVYKLELGQFLLHVGNANGTLGAAEVALLNVVFAAKYTAEQYQQLYSKVGAPSPEKSMSLMGSVSVDRVQSKHKGARSTDASNIMMESFDLMSKIMLMFDNNPTAAALREQYVEGMKAYVASQL